MPSLLQSLQEMVYQNLRPAQMLENRQPHLIWQQANSLLQQLPGELRQNICIQLNRKEQKARAFAWKIAITSLCNCLHEYLLTLQSLPLDTESMHEYLNAYTLFRNQLYQRMDVLANFTHAEEVPLPRHIHEVEKSILEAEIVQLEKSLSKKISDALLTVLLQPYREACIANPPPTREKITYLHQLTQLLLQKSAKSFQNAETALLQILIRANFNSTALISFILDDIRESAPHNTPALSYFREQQMQVKRMQSSQQPGLFPAEPDCKSSVLLQLDDEIAWLSAMQPVAVNRIPEQALLREAPLLTSNLTGGQLAVLLRWCHQTGILRANNNRQLWKLLAATIQTAGGKKCKAQSLQTEYYELDAAAIEGARDGIIRLLNESRRN